MPGDIWWGDVLRAQEALQAWTPERFTTIARTLGFANRDTSEVRPATRAQPSLALDPEVPFEEPAPAPEAALEDDGRVQPVPHQVLAPIDREPIATALAGGSVLARSGDVRQLAVFRHQPLLAPRSTSAILQYLLSRLVSDGSVDEEAMIEEIAAGGPLTGLPRRRQRTLRFGAEVLIDLGESMRPFRQDQVQVLASVRAVVGTAATTVQYFADAPLRGTGTGPRSTWRTYRPPSAGSAVLILTDFGIGGDMLSLDRSSVGEWMELFTMLRHRQCRPVGLVPYPSARWPDHFRRMCPMLTWDRNVTVGHARMAMS